MRCQPCLRSLCVPARQPALVELMPDAACLNVAMKCCGEKKPTNIIGSHEQDSTPAFRGCNSIQRVEQSTMTRMVMQESNLKPKCDMSTTTRRFLNGCVHILQIISNASVCSQPQAR